jgi:hypothetical protein
MLGGYAYTYHVIKCLIMLHRSFVAHDQLLAVIYPAKAAFDFPALAMRPYGTEAATRPHKERRDSFEFPFYRWPWQFTTKIAEKWPCSAQMQGESAGGLV